MANKIPNLVAHRGYPARFPENTLEGFGAALAAGARYVEFDIQLSADHVPMVIHDQNLMRTANLNIEVSKADCAALKQHSVGEPGRFGDQYAAVKIPSLDEVVELLKKWPDARAFVEIKRSSLRRFGRWKVLAAVLKAIRPALEQCIVISFDRKIIQDFQREGSCQTGWVMSSFDEVTYRQAVKLSPDFLFFDVETMPPADQPLAQENWEWAGYVVNDPDQALQLAEHGVGLVETNDIGEMLKHPLLKQKASNSGG
jgi:glycerophosphoryl diester phosphodiesterase